MSYGRSMEAPMDFSYTMNDNERPLKRPFNFIDNKDNKSPFFDYVNNSNNKLVGSNTPFLFNTTNAPPPPASSGFHYGSNDNDNEHFKWDVKTSLGLGEVEMKDVSPDKKENSKLKVSNGAVNKMRKRRMKNNNKINRLNDEHYDSYESYDSDNCVDSNDTNISRIEDLPQLISNYAHTGFTMFLLLGLASLGFKLVRTIMKDVEHKVEVYTQALNSESASCARSYALNQCDPSTRVPVSEEACRNWEQCMHRDPTTVGIARVGAAAFAEIVEGFANELGLRGGLLVMILLAFFWMIRNVGMRNTNTNNNVNPTSINPQQMKEFQKFLQTQTNTLNTNKKKSSSKLIDVSSNRWGGRGNKLEPIRSISERRKFEGW